MVIVLGDMAGRLVRNCNLDLHVPIVSLRDSHMFLERSFT